MKVKHQQKQQGPESQTKHGKILTSRLFQLKSDDRDIDSSSNCCVFDIWIITHNINVHTESQLLWLDVKFGPDHHSSTHVY